MKGNHAPKKASSRKESDCKKDVENVSSSNGHSMKADILNTPNSSKQKTTDPSIDASNEGWALDRNPNPEA